jgi:hypothetical protein
VAGTLATLPRLIEVHALRPPATIILGQVVRLHEKLDWYGRLPLFGKRIVVTRAKGQAETLSAKLHELGADVVELPTIEIRPASDYAPLDRALDSLACYDWLIFTSVNGVRFFLERLDRSGCDLRNMRARLCAIGPATRAALERVHLKVDLMGREYVAEGLVAALAPYDLAYSFRGPPKHATWFPRNWRGAAPWLMSSRPIALWFPRQPPPRPARSSAGLGGRTASLSPALRRSRILSQSLVSAHSRGSTRFRSAQSPRGRRAGPVSGWLRKPNRSQLTG